MIGLTKWFGFVALLGALGGTAWSEVADSVLPLRVLGEKLAGTVEKVDADPIWVVLDRAPASQQQELAGQHYAVLMDHMNNRLLDARPYDLAGNQRGVNMYRVFADYRDYVSLFPDVSSQWGISAIAGDEISPMHRFWIQGISEKGPLRVSEPGKHCEVLGVGLVQGKPSRYREQTYLALQYLEVHAVPPTATETMVLSTPGDTVLRITFTLHNPETIHLLHFQNQQSNFYHVFTLLTPLPKSLWKEREKGPSFYQGVIEVPLAWILTGEEGCYNPLGIKEPAVAKGQVHVLSTWNFAEHSAALRLHLSGK